MLSRCFAFAGLLLLGGCAYDAGYVESNYASQRGSVASDYSSVDYGVPYRRPSPVWGDPYVSGPVIGPIYSYGDSRDDYGGPVFSPYYGIQCDRRRNICWGRNGPDDRWSQRFFGHRHAHWNGAYGGSGGDGDGDWNHGNGHHQGGWDNGGHGHGSPGPNPGGGNPQPWVYQVPRDPDGRGTPTFLPNGCGANGQPPC